ncbi:MAG TPA: LysM peptidoglycan-binding domain-containing protein [Nitrospiraceae bacterium]|nr:LysM peptidoglycan-binding domain-containing protein [Nitrospiraceae bacterium]
MTAIKIGRALMVAGLCLATTGCVFKETYEAEKARSLNFQRLLAQEEKRTAELDSEVKRVKRDAADYEARNRELSAQVQAVREQLARTQEEADSLREAMALQEKAQMQMKRITPPAPSKAKPTELLPPLQESIAKAPEVPDPLMGDSTPVPSDRRTVQHVVKPGDTIFRLSRKYGTSVAKIREWNRLQDDIIEVGQKLIVGME